jgi:hypothetical protein
VPLMYRDVFPSPPVGEKAFEFEQFGTFRRTVREVLKSLNRAGMNPEKIDFQDRISQILLLEDAQMMLFDYVDEMKAYFRSIYDAENLEMLRRLTIKMAANATIQAKINSYGDWIISAPLLGISVDIAQYQHRGLRFAYDALQAQKIPCEPIKKALSS